MPRRLASVHRVTVFFDGCAGAGQITGTEVFSPEVDQLLESDAAEAILESTIPTTAGDGCNAIPGTVRPPKIRNQEPGTKNQAPEPTALGTLLDGAILTLLDSRHPGWAEGEGSAGEVEIQWSRAADGTLRISIGGTIGYRSLVVTTYPFWALESAPLRRSAVA